MQVGAQTITWGETIRQEMKSILGFLLRSGYAGVETGMRHFDPSRPQYYRELYRELDMTPLAVHAGGRFWDPAQAAEEMRNIDRAIDFAAAVGFGCLVVSGNPEESPASMHAMVPTYRDLARRCAGAGLRFAYHNHNWELASGGEILRLLAEETGSDPLEFVLDIAWAHRAGADIGSLLREFGGRIAYVHVKDVRGETFCELGTGEIDFDAILPVMRELDLRWIVVEQDTTSKTAEESMLVNMAFLRDRGVVES